MSSPQIFTEAAVRAAVSMQDAIAATRHAFLAADAGALSSAPPWHLDVDGRGEVHVKGAHLTGQQYFSVKTSTGFPANAAAGLCTSSGYTAVFDAATGAPVALLLDGGYLTELRTGAAGAIALDLLATPDLQTLVVIGTGGQARFQIEGALEVRRPHHVRILGRNRERAAALAAWVTDSFAVTADARELDDTPVQGEAIVTVTGATTPVLQRHQVAAGTHVTAVGADGPGKRELAPDLVAAADLFAVDDLSQSVALGELKDIPNRAAVTIGALLRHGTPAWTADRISIADLTGLGAQDAALATAAVTQLLTSQPATAGAPS
jgi:ornithine cyclodeaminase